MPHPNTQTQRPLLDDVSGGSDQIRVEYNANLPPQQIQQDRNPLAFGHALEQAEAGRECAFENANLVAGPKPRAAIQFDKSGGVFAIPQRLDDSHGYGNWIIAVAY